MNLVNIFSNNVELHLIYGFIILIIFFILHFVHRVFKCFKLKVHFNKLNNVHTLLYSIAANFIGSIIHYYFIFIIPLTCIHLLLLLHVLISEGTG